LEFEIKVCKIDKIKNQIKFIKELRSISTIAPLSTLNSPLLNANKVCLPLILYPLKERSKQIYELYK